MALHREASTRPPEQAPAPGPGPSGRTAGDPGGGEHRSRSAWRQARAVLRPDEWDPERSSALTRRTAVALAASIVVLGTAGVLAEMGSAAFAVFDLDVERRVAALFSAGVLGLAMLATSAAVRTGAEPSLRLVGGLFGFMAVDEFLSLHERLERWLGIDWQVLYLPAFSVAAVLALLAAWNHRRDRAFVGLWVGGGAAWALSQVLEKLQWDGGTKLPGYTVMMSVEEVLEMTGSACFVVAMVVLTHRVAAVRAGASSRRPAPAHREGVSSWRTPPRQR